MNKKIISLILLTVLLFTFASCQDKKTDDTKNTFKTNSQNTTGNSSVNIINDGKIAYQDDWYYFNTGEGLYKIKNDGTEKQQISSFVLDDLNVIGEWVYCSSAKGAFKLNVNTNEQHYLTYKTGVDCVTVIDDYVYYRTRDDGIYKIRTDGTEETLLLNEYGTEFFSIDKNWIYYFVRNEDVNGLYRIKTDGTENTLLYTSEYFKDGSLKKIFVIDEWIYFAKIYVHETGNKGIYRLKTDGSEFEAIRILDENEYLEDFNLLNNHLFYELDIRGEKNSKTYKSELDGTNETEFSLNSDRVDYARIYDYSINDLYISEVQNPANVDKNIFEIYNNNDELLLRIE